MTTALDLRQWNDQGQFTEVLRQTEAVFWLLPEQATERAVALFGLSRQAEAQYLLRGAAQQGVRRAQLHQAVILMHLGALHDAEQRLRMVLPQLEPGDLVNGRQWYARCLALLGQSGDALKQAELAVAQAAQPGTSVGYQVEALATLASLLLRSGAYAQARLELEQALLLLSDHGDVLLYWRVLALHIRILLFLDLEAQARSHFEQAKAALMQRSDLAPEISRLAQLSAKRLEGLLGAVGGDPLGWSQYSALFDDPAAPADLEHLVFDVPYEIERRAHIGEMDAAMRLAGQWPGYRVGAPDADLTLGIAFALADNLDAAKALLRRSLSSPQLTPRIRARSELYLAMTEHLSAAPPPGEANLRRAVEHLKAAGLNFETRTDLYRLASKLPPALIRESLDPVTRYQFDQMTRVLVEINVLGPGQIRFNHREVKNFGIQRAYVLLLLLGLARAKVEHRDISGDECITAISGKNPSYLSDEERRKWQKRLSSIVLKIRQELGADLITNIGDPPYSSYNLNTDRYQFVIDLLYLEEQFRLRRFGWGLRQLKRGVMTGVAGPEGVALEKLRSALIEQMRSGLKTLVDDAEYILEAKEANELMVEFEAFIAEQRA